MRWSSREAAKFPRILNLHVSPFQIRNPEDLQADLQLDSVGFQEWIAPRFAAYLRKECRLDTVVLLEPLPVRQDSAVFDGFTSRFARPIGPSPAGRTLFISNGASTRFWRSARGMNNLPIKWVELVVGSNYLLVDGPETRDLAYGATAGSATYVPDADARSRPANVSSWDKAVADFAEDLCSELRLPTGAPPKSVKAR